jgi:subtilisin
MDRRRLTRLISSLFIVILLIAPLAHGQGRANDYIVLYRDGVPAAERAAVAARSGASIHFNYAGVSATAVNVPNANVLAALSNNPAVLQVIPDRPVSAVQQRANAKGKPGGGGETAGQTVPLGVTRVGIPAEGSDGTGIGVAIIDTGIDFNHADIAPASPSFTAFTGTCQDNNGHGTHVAGTVAALDNGIDVIGVAPNAKVYCVKVLDGSGSGSDATVMAGLDWVLTNHDSVDPKIRVMNMSFGRPGTLDDNQPMHDLISALAAAGVVSVVAAGNDPSLEVSQNVPATYPEVFAVASTTAAKGTSSCRFLSSAIGADTASYFTTDGKFAGGIGVTISAPGEDQENVSTGCLISSVGILSLKLGGGTTRMSGTSMATPHVTGLVARYMQRGDSGVETIRANIRNTADRITEVPLNSPTSSYTYDGEREGIAKAP